MIPPGLPGGWLYLKVQDSLTGRPLCNGAKFGIKGNTIVRKFADAFCVRAGFDPAQVWFKVKDAQLNLIDVDLQRRVSDYFGKDGIIFAEVPQGNPQDAEPVGVTKDPYHSISDDDETDQ